ncbi:MAG: hypothetical protein ACFB00_09915, partial [Parvularculaceae bacterium]
MSAPLALARDEDVPAADDAAAFAALGDAQWRDAALAALLLAVDPAGLAGVRVRAFAGPARRAWLDGFRALLGDVPFRVAPSTVDDERLVGGLDLAASLGRGAPRLARGLLAEANGGALALAGAERVDVGVAGAIAAAMDAGRVTIERAGLRDVAPAQFALVALDEGEADDPYGEATPEILLDRLAFDIRLDAAARRSFASGWPDVDISAARARLDSVAIDPETIAAMASAAEAIGARDVRGLLFSLRTARAHAALQGRDAVADEDAEVAVRLALVPRAGPGAVEAPSPTSDDVEPAAAKPDDASPTSDDAPRETSDVDPLADKLVAAARSAVDAASLATLADGAPARRGARSAHGGKRVRPSQRARAIEYLGAGLAERWTVVRTPVRKPYAS